jgi:hypothetical protein
MLTKSEFLYHMKIKILDSNSRRPSRFRRQIVRISGKTIDATTKNDASLLHLLVEQTSSSYKRSSWVRSSNGRQECTGCQPLPSEYNASEDVLPTYHAVCLRVVPAFSGIHSGGFSNRGFPKPSLSYCQSRTNRKKFVFLGSV